MYLGSAALIEECRSSQVYIQYIYSSNLKGIYTIV